MPEHQYIEYKSSWHDDFLKWICGFANAQGGTIYVGLDDNGNIIGVKNYKELMDDIPNKIRNQLGLMVDINLHQKKGKHFIEIVTPPYSVAISLRGRYYYRSGSTKQELTGPALNDFLLKKAGKSWDDIAEPRAKIQDIDKNTVKAFLEAAGKSGRIPDYSNLSLTELLEKLRLIENKKIKRAAIILFGKDPGKFYPNTFVKLGRFSKTEADIQFQEMEEGNLFTLLTSVLNQLNRKFLTSKISFEGMQRIEKGEYPVAALREMLLNALVHRNYMGAAIQIRVYDAKFSIWNEGLLPADLTLASLKRQHPSRPRNPVIAEVCFKGGFIDSWGRGTIKILESCKAAKLPEPEMKEQDGGFLITLFKDYLTEKYLVKLGLNQRQVKAVMYVKEHLKISNNDYQKLFDVSRISATRELAKLVESGVFESSNVKGPGSFYKLVIAS